MTKHSDGATINQGGASKPTIDEAASVFVVTGNAERRGEKPSPGDRGRGETSVAARGDAGTVFVRACCCCWLCMHHRQDCATPGKSLLAGTLAVGAGRA